MRRRTIEAPPGPRSERADRLFRFAVPAAVVATPIIASAVVVPAAIVAAVAIVAALAIVARVIVAVIAIAFAVGIGVVVFRVRCGRRDPARRWLLQEI